MDCSVETNNMTSDTVIAYGTVGRYTWTWWRTQQLLQHTGLIGTYGECCVLLYWLVLGTNDPHHDPPLRHPSVRHGQSLLSVQFCVCASHRNTTVHAQLRFPHFRLFLWRKVIELNSEWTVCDTTKVRISHKPTKAGEKEKNVDFLRNKLRGFMLFSGGFKQNPRFSLNWP